jgi:hypothetical protein
VFELDGLDDAGAYVLQALDRPQLRTVTS